MTTPLVKTATLAAKTATTSAQSVKTKSESAATATAPPAGSVLDKVETKESDEKQESRKRTVTSEKKKETPKVVEKTKVRTTRE